MNATTHPRRPRTIVAASAIAMLLAATTAASAQEPSETDPSVTCDAELLDEDEGFPFYLVEPGESVACTAVGLDPALDVEWLVDVFGANEDAIDLDPENLDLLEEPTATFGSEGPLSPTVDGELSFEFTIPDDLVFGIFEGTVWQGEEEEEQLSYEEFFGGLIFGLLEGNMTCEPDPAPRGGEVDCLAELNPGEFDWEVYELSVRQLLDGFIGEEELAPTAEGSGEADDEGFGGFGFALSSTGDAEVYFTVAYQDDALAFYAGEIVPAEDTTEEPVDDDPTDDTPTVTVPRPNRVDAGAGGAAPTSGTPVAAIVLALTLTAGVALRRVATQEG